MNLTFIFYLFHSLALCRSRFSLHSDVSFVSASHKLVCPMGPGYGPDGLGELSLLLYIYL